MSMDMLLITTAILLPCGLFFSFKHFSLYKEVVSSLSSRGVEVKALTMDFVGYGSAGLMKKINLIITTLDSQLLDSEKTLLLKSRKYYNLQALTIIPFLITLFCFIFDEKT